MALEELLGDKGTQKFTFFTLGFLTIFLIVLSFRYLSEKIPGVKENYLNLFCTNIK
jgi:hypothetical protein